MSTRNIVTITKALLYIITLAVIVHGLSVFWSPRNQVRPIWPDGRVIHMLILGNNLLHQDAIELCSVYSIARSNPLRPVIVHTRGQLPDSKLWSQLRNINTVIIDESTICAGTPAERFFQKFLRFHLNTSIHAIAEMSDILRFCIIYKFGGTYVDSDVIQFKPFPAENFVAKQDNEPMCSVFDLNAGDATLRDIMATFESGYRPGKWGSVGPTPFKRFAHRNDTMFLPNHAFYPIPYPLALKFFIDVAMAENARRRISAHNETLGVHIFRAMFAFEALKSYSSKSALGTLMRDFCPSVYEAKMVNEEFTFTEGLKETKK